MTRPELDQLSREQLIELVIALARRVEALEARLNEPPKNSGNSSVPPSRDRKPNRPPREPGARREASVGRAGGGRRLHPNPDRTIEAQAESCPHCAAALTAAQQQPMTRYDKIELPPVRPVVTRVVLHGGRCPCCKAAFLAPAPAGLEPGSPFGSSIVAMALYLRTTHAIGFERLAATFGHLFGLAISQGALVNMIERAKPQFAQSADAIQAQLRRARVICSDETSARVQGRNWWQWVFQNPALCLHVIRPSRAAEVPKAVLDGHRPAVWVSDLFTAQRGHGRDWQLCLAHQIRDLKFAIEAGDRIFAPRLKRLLLRAIAISHRSSALAPATRKQYRYQLERRLDTIMVLQPTTPDGRRLRKRYLADRSHLFTFVTNPDVPPTNNGSERDLRPSVIFRKVTNGFRSQWGAQAYAAVRSII
ncbi:MAG TPA: IS66 family transposase, partial [Dongiaceae bacterium]